MHIDRAYLAHCITAVEAANESRSPHSLCLIDGAILGALPVNTEHAYRVAHHADVAVMREWQRDRTGIYGLTPAESAAADCHHVLGGGHWVEGS